MGWTSMCGPRHYLPRCASHACPLTHGLSSQMALLLRLCRSMTRCDTRTRTAAERGSRRTAIRVLNLAFVYRASQSLRVQQTPLSLYLLHAR